MEHIFALLIAMAYLCLTGILVYLWLRFPKALAVHKPIWWPLVLMTLSSAISNGLFALGGNIYYPELWVIIRGCVVVTVWGVVGSFLFMLPKVREADSDGRLGAGK